MSAREHFRVAANTNPKSLSSSILWMLKDNEDEPLTLRSISAAAVNQLIKGISIARGTRLRKNERDLITRLSMEGIEIDGQIRTTVIANISRLSPNMLLPAPEVPKEKLIKIGNATPPNKLTGSILYNLMTQGFVCTSTIGAGALNQAVKAIAAVTNIKKAADIVIRPWFEDIELEEPGQPNKITTSLLVLIQPLYPSQLSIDL
jgi:stage V sporulation protein SpoVS